VKEVVGNGTVLMPAQICPVVTHTVVSASLGVKFVDADLVYPTPSPGQYRAALDDDTVGVIISPLYGYLQKDWQDLFPLPRGVRIILDLAQGFFLTPHLDPRLLEQADAVLFSFALGKGFDTGGALLYTSNNLPLSGITSVSRAFFLQTLGRALILRSLIMSKTYGFFLQRLDEAVDADKECHGNQISRQLAPSDLICLWEDKLEAVNRDIHRAQARAVEIGALPLVSRAVADQTFFDPQAMHLRQIIRCRDQFLRDRILTELKNYSIDCAPAGEPLPSEYFGDGGTYPNAAAFRQEALRLPFLGRLPEKKFHSLKQQLEKALGKYLPH